MPHRVLYAEHDLLYGTLAAGAAVERVDPGYPMGWGSRQSFPDRSVVTMLSPNGASRHTVLYGGPLCTLSRALVIPRENLGRFMAQSALKPQLCLQPRAGGAGYVAERLEDFDRDGQTWTRLTCRNRQGELGVYEVVKAAGMMSHVVRGKAPAESKSWLWGLWGAPAVAEPANDRDRLEMFCAALFNHESWGRLIDAGATAPVAAGRVHSCPGAPAIEEEDEQEEGPGG